MNGDVEVANSALTLIGTKSIIAIDEQTKEGRQIKLVYNACRQFVLRIHPWNFAIKRVTLSPLSQAPPFGFANQFELPGGFIRVLEINQNADIDYAIEGKTIQCDESTIELKYLYDVIDITQWDSLACMALAAFLAWKISYSLTSSSELKDALWKDFLNILKKARNVDAQEEPAKELEANDFLISRAGFNEGFVRDPMTN